MVLESDNDTIFRLLTKHHVTVLSTVLLLF